MTLPTRPLHCATLVPCAQLPACESVDTRLRLCINPCIRAAGNSSGARGTVGCDPSSSGASNRGALDGGAPKLRAAKSSSKAAVPIPSTASGSAHHTIGCVGVRPDILPTFSLSGSDGDAVPVCYRQLVHVMSADGRHQLSLSRLSEKRPNHSKDAWSTRLHIQPVMEEDRSISCGVGRSGSSGGGSSHSSGI